jgi:hypothetical protein
VERGGLPLNLIRISRFSCRTFGAQYGRPSQPGLTARPNHNRPFGPVQALNKTGAIAASLPAGPGGSKYLAAFTGGPKRRREAPAGHSREPGKGSPSRGCESLRVRIVNRPYPRPAATAAGGGKVAR